MRTRIMPPRNLPQRPSTTRPRHLKPRPSPTAARRMNPRETPRFPQICLTPFWLCSTRHSPTLSANASPQTPSASICWARSPRSCARACRVPPPMRSCAHSAPAWPRGLRCLRRNPRLPTACVRRTINCVSASRIRNAPSRTASTTSRPGRRAVPTPPP